MTMMSTMTWATQIKELTVQYLEVKRSHTLDAVALADPLVRPI